MAQSQNTTIVLDDGTATTVERWGDSGPVMLCIHGMASSRKSWKRLANRYASRFRVVAYDQRGHGDSAAIHGPMQLDRGVRDLENVVAAIGGADVMVGHSWGGAIAIRGGTKLPVQSVVAIDPMIVQVDDTWYDEYLVELEETFTLTGSARDEATRNEYADWHPDDIEGKVHAVHSMTSVPIARLRRDNAGCTWDLRTEIAHYTKPLLLLMAEAEGSIVPTGVIEDVARNHSDHVRIATVTGGGHNFYRTDFERTADEIDAFLKANQPASTATSQE